MADKLTQQLTDALAKAAAQPNGLPLYATKSDAGLFPNTSAAKSAAQKCLADGLVHAIGTDPKAKSPRELYAADRLGLGVPAGSVNPKQVLEDFVRVLEARQGEVGELLDTARRMADSLQGLKDAVARVLPNVSATRMPMSYPSPRWGEGGGASQPGEGSAARVVKLHPSPPTPLPSGERGETVALLDAPPQIDLAPAILARLSDWSARPARIARCRSCTARYRSWIRPPRSASSTTACGSCMPMARSTCTRGPARSTPCPNRPTRSSPGTTSPITPRLVGKPKSRKANSRTRRFLHDRHHRPNDH